MADIKAKVGINQSKKIGAKVANQQKLQVTNARVGIPYKLGDITDIDMTLLEQGAMLVYDESQGKWIAKQTLQDGTSFEGGHY